MTEKRKKGQRVEFKVEGRTKLVVGLTVRREGSFIDVG